MSVYNVILSVRLRELTFVLINPMASARLRR